MHVHVYHAHGEAKYWMEPSIELSRSHGLSRQLLRKAETLIKEHEHEIRAAWQAHFGGRSR